jgi:hypothetical protein
MLIRRGLIGEQEKLKRFGHWYHAWAEFADKCVSERPIGGGRLSL